jgi:cytochrome P450
MTTVAPPPPYRLDNPVFKLGAEFARQYRLRGALPPGPTNFDPRRDVQMLRDTLGLMLPAYERYGPVFTMRAGPSLMVMAVGAEPLHQILVTDADRFHWREGMYSELIPFLGDGLITTDAEYHDRSRRLMLPVFHTERLEAATRVMAAEVDRSLDGWPSGQAVDVYDWARYTGMRVAMRALFGFDPDAMDGAHAVHEFERGLSFYGNSMLWWLVRGPRSPHARMRAARREIVHLVRGEISRRRRVHDVAAQDILSLLIAAEDEDGWRFSDEQLLDHTITLLFAGHDTTTTTVALMLGELARSPEWLERVVAELGDRPVTEEQLMSGLPVLEQVLDETLRLYPPVPGGLRRAETDVELAGVPVPAGATLMYSSYATHHLAQLFEDPHAFRPERMSRERKAKLPKGAYVPFGGGRRICIGKRFGYLEAKVMVSRVLQRFSLQPVSGEPARLRWAATLVPIGGVPMVVRRR